MTSHPPDFLTSFRRLPGLSLAEKKRNLQSLIRATPPSDDVTITPGNYQEEVLKTQLLLTLRRFHPLLEVLKSGDNLLARKLLKDRWFSIELAKAFETEPSKVVEEVLPKLSYFSRLRVLRAVGKCCEGYFDGVFEAVLRRYGLETAREVLLGCSEGRIEEVIEEYRPVLSSRVLKKLFLRSRRCFEVYCCERSNIEGSVWKFVAREDLRYFYGVLLRRGHGYVEVKLGKRVTHNYLNIFEEYAVENCQEMVKKLHGKTAVSVLWRRQKLRQFCFAIFPKEIEELTVASEFRSFIEVALRRDPDLFMDGFEEVYGKPLWEFPEDLYLKLFECLSGDQKSRMVQRRGGSKAAKEILKLQKSIERASTNFAKINLMKEMVEVCRRNNDLEALASVISCVQKQQCSSVTTFFLEEVRSKVNLEKLNERHWTNVMPLVAQLRFYNDQETFNLEYLKFLRTPSKNQVVSFMRRFIDGYRYDYSKAGSLEKHLLLRSIEFMSEIKDEDDDLEIFDMSLICSVLDWNDRNKTDMIRLDHHWLLESFRDAVKRLKNDDPRELLSDELCRIFSVIIIKNDRFRYVSSGLHQEVFEAWLSLSERFFSTELFFWCLKRRPEILFEAFPKFLEYSLVYFFEVKFEASVYYCIKQYPFLRDTTIDYCLAKQDNTNDCLYFQKIMSILAILLPPDDLLEFVKTYPADQSVEENKEAVVNALKYSNTSEVCPVLLSYFSDYSIENSTNSLYRLCLHIPEFQAVLFVEDHVSKSSLPIVSRHSAQILTLIAPVQAVIPGLKLSTRKPKVVLKYFFKSPSHEAWELVKETIEKFDLQASFLEVAKIPLKYHVELVEALSKHFCSNSFGLILQELPVESLRKLPLDFLVAETVKKSIFSHNLAMLLLRDEAVLQSFITELPKLDRILVRNFVQAIIKVAAFSDSTIICTKFSATSNTASSNAYELAATIVNSASKLSVTSDTVHSVGAQDSSIGNTNSIAAKPVSPSVDTAAVSPTSSVTPSFPTTPTTSSTIAYGIISAGILASISLSKAARDPESSSVTSEVSSSANVNGYSTQETSFRNLEILSRALNPPSFLYENLLLSFASAIVKAHDSFEIELLQLLEEAVEAFGNSAVDVFAAALSWCCSELPKNFDETDLCWRLVKDPANFRGSRSKLKEEAAFILAAKLLPKNIPVWKKSSVKYYEVLKILSESSSSSANVLLSLYLKST